MIKSIEVKKLHGYLDKKIVFDTKENFLLGINGSGKTSILKIIDSFFNDKNMSLLKESDFALIEIKTTNNTYRIKKSLNKLKILTPELARDIEILKQELENRKKLESNSDKFKILFFTQELKLENKICDYTLEVVQKEIKREKFLTITSEEIGESIAEKDFLSVVKKLKSDEDEELKEKFCEYFSPIKKAERILEDEALKYLGKKNRIYDILIENVSKSNDLREAEVFFSNFEEEVSVLKKPIEKFTEILNIFLVDSYKKIIFNENRGKFKIKTLDEKKTIPLDKLSSGEKHLITLFTNIYFNLEESYTLLIDEPERSLHIEWQKNFIPQLKKALEDKKIQIIVATHSPYIVKEVERKNLIGLFPYNRDDER